MKRGQEWMKGEPIKAAALFLITLKSPKDAREILVSTKKRNLQEAFAWKLFSQKIQRNRPIHAPCCNTCIKEKLGAVAGLALAWEKMYKKDDCFM